MITVGMLYVSTAIVILVALCNDEPHRDEPLGMLRIVWLSALWLPVQLACLFRRDVGPIERDR